MKKIFCFGFVIALFFCTSKFSLAYVAECDGSGRQCDGSRSCVCDSYKYTNCVSCSYGCSGGYCECRYGGRDYSSKTANSFCKDSYTWNCDNGSWTKQNCPNGCGSDGINCAVNGKCNSDVNNTSRSSVPKSSSRCSKGSPTNFHTSPDTPRIIYEGWEWTCAGSNGGSDADCQAYLSCQKYSLNHSFDKGTCELPAICITKFDGTMWTKTFDCAFGGAGCCMYDTNLIECSPEGTISNCRKCIWDGPGISHWESISTDGDDGECAQIDRGYCNYSAIPKCNTDYGVINDDSTGSDGEFNWRCKGQSSSGCRSAGSSMSCDAVKVDPAVSTCGPAADVGKIYVVQSGITPDNTELCGANNKYDIDCASPTCDMNGEDGTLNWTCTGDCNTPINCSAPNDVIPQVTPTIGIYPDVSGTPTPVKPDVRNGASINNNCQGAFNGSNKVVWSLQITDTNGFDDIKSAQLKFTPTSGGIEKTSAIISPDSLGKASYVMDASTFTPGTYKVEYQLEDVNDPPGKSAWTDSTRNFKVWDCLVGIGGTIFDSSDLVSSLCSSNLGYANLIADNKIFQLTYSGNNTKKSEMIVSAPYFSDNNENSRKLVWSDKTTYTASFNDFPGIAPDETKANNQCIGSLVIDLGDTRIVDPYSDNPTVNVQYSSIMEQDPWFSVVDSDIVAGGKVNNYVPITCPLNNTTDPSVCSTSVRGIIWTKSSTSSLSSHDQAKSNGKEYINKPIDIGDYTYNSLINNYFNKFGIGTTFLVDQIWSNIKSSTGVVLIEKNLTINENINDGQFRIIIASDTITIDPVVNQINAVLIANSVKANGTSTDQLVINGSVYGYNSVDFRRTYTNTLDNNTNPSVLVQYDPSLPFKMPKEVVKVITQWKME